MRAVVQRIAGCAVRVEGRQTGSISRGLLVYLGVGREDSDRDLAYLVDKVVNLRIFPDGQGKMNLSISDTKGEILVVSQFTLYGDAREGRRPSYSGAAEGEQARGYYLRFLEQLKQKGFAVQAGEFAASMEVSYTNVGPVTILLDSRKLF